MTKTIEKTYWLWREVKMLQDDPDMILLEFQLDAGSNNFFAISLTNNMNEKLKIWLVLTWVIAGWLTIPALAEKFREHILIESDIILKKRQQLVKEQLECIQKAYNKYWYGNRQKIPSSSGTSHYQKHPWRPHRNSSRKTTRWWDWSLNDDLR